VRLAYADPPYPGMSGFYKDHPDFGGEVDHEALIADLVTFDGWCLHTASTTLGYVLRLVEEARARALGRSWQFDFRVMAWVKPFASFKKNVAVAYAWEPVIVKAARPRRFDGYTTITDWVAEPITLRRGLTGAKPEAVCRWLFECMGAEQADELLDVYPGTGAVARAWNGWRSQLPLLPVTAAANPALRRDTPKSEPGGASGEVDE
jgi:hypothetical protein